MYISTYNVVFVINDAIGNCDFIVLFWLAEEVNDYGAAKSEKAALSPPLVVEDQPRRTSPYTTGSCGFTAHVQPLRLAKNWRHWLLSN